MTVTITIEDEGHVVSKNIEIGCSTCDNINAIKSTYLDLQAELINIKDNMAQA